jgi:hypothetical protein
MRIVIEGHDRPGAEFVSDGVPLHNVHVAVQIGKDPFGLVRGDADSARWEIDVRTVVADGGFDLRGPAMHGTALDAGQTAAPTPRRVSRSRLRGVRRAC